MSEQGIRIYPRVNASYHQNETVSIAAQSFSSFQQWVNKASSWLTSHEHYHPEHFRAICFDSKGRFCRIGRDFMRADVENAFPVYWVWPDQNLFKMIDIEREV